MLADVTGIEPAHVFAKKLEKKLGSNVPRLSRKFPRRFPAHNLICPL